ERRVEGVLISGDKVLLVDDLLTTGLTLKNSVEALRAEGGIVNDVVVFLDREEGGKQLLESNGVKVHALLNVSDVANSLFETGAIDKESLKTILKQIKK
ncbi:MAG TPA: phosphoribosyltransferase family protein, partial [Candidatus Acidoferrales bacterium]|nr:phosphoribosyltransferase family protein [Candidatus Acidoferrales bacterium]